MKKIDVTISIASFNTGDLTRKCIESLITHTKGIPFEIIVVDNGSSDGSVELLRTLQSEGKIHLIENKKNMFFSHANNQAFAKAHGEYFLILNADAYVADNSIKKMVDYMREHSEVGLMEGIEKYEDGTLQQTGSLHSSPLVDFYELSFIGKRFKNQEAIDTFRMAANDRSTTYEIDVACDAFCIIPSSLFKKISGYDEKFLLYYTENDLSKRVQKEGKKIMHFGGATVFHKVSVSANSLKWKKLWIYYHDLLSYYVKNEHLISGIMLYALLMLELIALRIFRARMFEN